MTEFIPPVGFGPASSDSCHGKLAFATMDAAEIAADRTPSDRGDPNARPYPYACPECVHYHIGHPAPEVAAGVATYDEWYRQNAGRAVQAARYTITNTTGLPAVWTRVGQAWRATVQHPTHGPVSSKPSADPGLAAESLLARWRRMPRDRAVA